MSLIMGRHSYDPPTIMGEANKVIVGNFTSISRGVTVDCGFQHHTDFVTTYPFPCIFPKRFSSQGCYPLTKGDVIIGSDVWIGQGVIIMSGLSIGHGSVVGAGAVVTKSIPPYTIVGGVPAKEIKKRFPKEIVDSLLSISWWEWDDEKIFSEMGNFLSTDIENFIKRHGGKIA